MLDCASVREHNDFAAQAQLHDKKVKSKSYDTIETWNNLKKDQAQDHVDYDSIEENMAKMMQDIKPDESSG